MSPITRLLMHVVIINVEYGQCLGIFVLVYLPQYICLGIFASVCLPQYICLDILPQDVSIGTFTTLALQGFRN